MLKILVNFCWQPLLLNFFFCKLKITQLNFIRGGIRFWQIAEPHQCSVSVWHKQIVVYRKKIPKIENGLLLQPRVGRWWHGLPQLRQERTPHNVGHPAPDWQNPSAPGKKSDQILVSPENLPQNIQRNWRRLDRARSKWRGYTEDETTTEQDEEPSWVFLRF